jgi:hypothetical protein
MLDVSRATIRRAKEALELATEQSAADDVGESLTGPEMDPFQPSTDIPSVSSPSIFIPHPAPWLMLPRKRPHPKRNPVRRSSQSPAAQIAKIAAAHVSVRSGSCLHDSTTASTNVTAALHEVISS